MEEDSYSSEGEENDESEMDKTGGETTKKKRKRNPKPPGHRRNIKSKYDTLDDLNPEALTAQNEEMERIRRLELQQSLLAAEMSRDLSHDTVSEQLVASKQKCDERWNERICNTLIVIHNLFF